MGVPVYQLSATFSPNYQSSAKNMAKYQLSVKIRDYQLTLEGIRGGWVGGSDCHPSLFLAFNFCSLTDYQKLWYNCSLFVNTYFYSNYVTSRLIMPS